jgi:signal transduction histidine kinase
MRKIVPIVLSIACFLWAVAALVDMASAADRGTAKQAQALVAKAIAAYDAKGKSAFADMTAPNTGFVDRDLYIFVIGPDHKTVAHGAAAARVGLDVMTLKDQTGKSYGKALFKRATPAGAWVDYVMEDPLTGKQAPKSSWVVRHGDYVFGCGIYKPGA